MKKKKKKKKKKKIKTFKIFHKDTPTRHIKYKRIDYAYCNE